MYNMCHTEEAIFPSFPKTVCVYTGYLWIITNNASYFFQKCPNLNDKLYSHKRCSLQFWKSCMYVPNNESQVSSCWKNKSQIENWGMNPLVLGCNCCCCCSVTQSCSTLCDLMDCSMPGFPVLHHLQELAQIHVHWVGDAIQPSRPLSSPSPPAFNLSQHQCLF